MERTKKPKSAPSNSQTALSHLDHLGRASMVNVGSKEVTTRKAIAGGEIRLSTKAMRLLSGGGVPKGDVFTVAKVAAIMAAKRTAELIPLCHPVPVSHVDIQFQLDEARRCVTVTAEASTAAQTGVEMEALTAAAVALLTIYDMMKAADKGMSISNVRLLRKEGGKSGLFVNEIGEDELPVSD
ncbi:MAG: cyclic pyranopterin monophosphate synthase MoaC [Candidatus Sumerlaeaceae bacterium]|nr:cyclic pyranopterin monophosphate synthase MoaC [Candidatus Sumerlaeaceae bacterium]